MMLLRDVWYPPRRKEAKVREKEEKDRVQQKKQKQDRIKAGKNAIRSMLDSGLGRSMPRENGGASREVTIKAWGDQQSVLACFIAGRQGGSDSQKEAAFLKELAECAGGAALPAGAGDCGAGAGGVEADARREVMECFTEDKCRQQFQGWWKDVDKTIASSKGVFSRLIQRCLQCECTCLTTCSRLRA